MKDIDFDELDKAVSSLMGSVKEKTDPSAPKTLSISPTLKEDELPEYKNIRQAAEKIGSETIITGGERTQVLNEITDDEVKTLTLSDSENISGPNTIDSSAVTAPEIISDPVSKVPASPPVVSRAPSGRFMDVMHPSSDMKTVSTTSKTPDAASIQSRVAKTIERPIQPRVIEAATPTVIPETPVLPVEQETLPDSQVQITPEPIAPLAPVPAESVVAPQTSPFLPDAREKVEKRPLGGVQDDADEFSSIEQPYKQDNSADTQLAPAAEVVELQEELRTNLLAIETNLAKPLEPELSDASATTVGQVNSTPRAPNETLDPNDGAIFDTTEYHKPVAHPAKHKSEWIWIVAIVLIIVICAAGAAAFYLLGMQ